jgi:hypothetical protein
MHFHEYVTMKPAGERGTTEDFIRSYLMTPHDGSQISIKASVRGAIELGWLERGRPFYNVYPIAVELCRKTALNMKWGDILLPTRYLLLRFAAGHEPLGIKCAALRVPSAGKESTPILSHVSRIQHAFGVSTIPLCGIIERTCDNRCGGAMWMYHGKNINDEVIKDSVLSSGNRQQNRGDPFFPDAEDDSGLLQDQVNFLIRLLAFIGLLAKGTDLITPAILSKDREEYDATSDESRKRWLEQRAKKRLGAGFDIGRSLEIERASSPHWRSPHLALFHTGPGRTVPTLKMRSGCVVIPKDMSSVPTGYLGEELPGESPPSGKPVYRAKIPHSLRMKIMDRDGRRCRACGMAAEDGVTLEVDHITPVAKGGSNEEANLWVLCRPCNSGKSDRILKNITPQFT